MDKHFVGVDYGARKVAVAVINQRTDAILLEDLVLTASHRDQELLAISSFIELTLGPRVATIQVAYIESAILGASLNAQTLVNLAYSAGAISLSLSMMRIPNSFIASASWKKLAVGSGAAKKADVMEWATNTWPRMPIKTQDQADALAMAACARMSWED